MPKKRKYTRRVNKVDPEAGLIARVATLGTVGQVVDTPGRPRLYRTEVFQKIETIFSDGSRTHEERTFNVNLNP